MSVKSDVLLTCYVYVCLRRVARASHGRPYIYMATVRPGVIVTWAHTLSNIVSFIRVRLSTRLPRLASYGNLPNLLSTERRDYGVGGNEKGHAALTKRPNKGSED